jgi:hypothetical protein
MPTFCSARRRGVALSLLLAAALAACDDTHSSSGATAPNSDLSQGSQRSEAPQSPNGSAYGLVACHRGGQQQGTAVIGPDGGTLRVGNSAVVVPPGALAERTRMTAKVLDTLAAIELEPHGLSFALPVDLTIDTRQCAVREDQHPVLLYLDDHGEVLETIDGRLGDDAENFVARIIHFSVYAVGV